MKDLKNNIEKDIQEDYINLYEVFLTIKREYKVLISMTLILSVIGFFKASLNKKIWQGYFQIVLSDKPSSNSNTSANLLNLLTSSSNSRQDLATEIKILESPIILMPVFNRFKKISINNPSNLKYSNWVSNIDVELETGTSVLNVYYKNENKKLILPVLNDISSRYQEYSKRDQKKKFNNSLNYINNQIEDYLVKSKLSLKNVQSFAIQNNLTPLTGEAEIDKEIKTWSNPNIPNLNKFDKIGFSNSNTNYFKVENERIKAANNIKVYEKKLDQLEKLKDANSIFLLGKTEELLGKLKIAEAIEDLNIEIKVMRSTFTDNEPKLRDKLVLKETYINTLKNELYGYFNARLMDAKARMNASERPEGVLVKYRELIREAARDEQFLKKLEYDKQVILLEKAIIVDPWELISNPTIFESPVNKSKKEVLLIWTLIGLGLGSALCLIKEKITDIIFSKNKLVKLIPYKLLANLNPNNTSDWTKEINAPLALLDINIENINLIPLGKTTIDNINKINSIFKKNYKSNIVNNANEINNKTDINILIIENKSIKNKEINEFIEKVVNYNLNINFWILINK